MTEPVDMFERLAGSPSGRRVLDMMEEAARQRDGVAAQAKWLCEDGYVVVYTTSRVEGGPNQGKFVTQLFKPVGKGARSGKATELRESYRRAFSTRKAAKARAEVLYRQHSPKYNERNPS